jgi:anthranilate/para-aminobenzoate synthase component I
VSSTSAYAALLQTEGACALLESTTSGPLARLSFLARNPVALLVADATGCRLRTASGVRTLKAAPFDALRQLLGQIGWRDGRPEGAIAGAIAYDVARPLRNAARGPLLIALAVEQLEVFAGGGEAGSATAPASGLTQLHLPAFSNLSREEYRSRVLRLKEHIAAGDIYQANFSQRFRLPWERGGLALYHHLRRISPAPFSGYLRAEGVEIVSASPERLLLVEPDGVASTRPIAGTRPRGRDPEADSRLASELIVSEKERAEHLMLVDLARNDLGRVAELGSVHVDELMSVETYAQVRHIVSNVKARLARDRDALDGFQALFPGGTITGVPKRRCMEILDASEPVPRGFYTGSLFYLTPSGRLDANILIRSAVVSGGTVTFHTGGGIVADSDPDFEYQETLHKAEGMRLALEAALAEPKSIAPPPGSASW